MMHLRVGTHLGVEYTLTVYELMGGLKYSLEDVVYGPDPATKVFPREQHDSLEAALIAGHAVARVLIEKAKR